MGEGVNRKKPKQLLLKMSEASAEKQAQPPVAVADVPALKDPETPNAEPVQKQKLKPKVQKLLADADKLKLRDIVHLTAERKSQLAQIFNLPSLDWSMRQAAAEEAGNACMEELEEATEFHWMAGFVLWKRMNDGCIRTVVFTLNRNTFYMDWTPVSELDDPEKEEKEKEFWEKKKSKRSKEIKDKKFVMGSFLLRHEYEPLGLFCVDYHDDGGLDDENDHDDKDNNKEPAWDPEVCTIWRFASGPNYTSADQDFLETVAHAMRFAPFADRAAAVWGDYCFEIDFWKQDRTFGFHFCE